MSIQIISKETGKYQVVKTVGSSSDARQIENLCGVGRDMIVELTQQERLNFELRKSGHWRICFSRGSMKSG